MTLPIEIVAVLAALGLIALCCAVLWAAPQLWYRIKYKRFRPTYEELELKHLRDMQELRTEHLQSNLTAEREKTEFLQSQLQETIDKIVSKL
jgi:hypothetical protein